MCLMCPNLTQALSIITYKILSNFIDRTRSVGLIFTKELTNTREVSRVNFFPIHMDGIQKISLPYVKEWCNLVTLTQTTSPKIHTHILTSFTLHRTDDTLFWMEIIKQRVQGNFDSSIGGLCFQPSDPHRKSKSRLLIRVIVIHSLTC